MAPASEIRFLLIGEDRGHRELLGAWTDRLLVGHIDWIDETNLEHVRRWLTDENHDVSFVAFPGNAVERARKRGLRVWGHFGGRPALLDAAEWRAMLLMAVARPEQPEIVVLARDVDNKPERAEGLRQAVEHRQWPFAIVAALPDPEIEAWLLAGWEPVDEREGTLLEGLRQTLGFDPTSKPHRTISTKSDAPHETKRVLRRLAPDKERESRCRDAPFERLRARGASSGIPGFLDEMTKVIRGIVPGRPTE